MYQQLLPIGSIVKLKEAERRVMIYGILQQTPEDEIFDYVGVPYPEGYTTVMTKVAFQHSDIEEVEFRGYEDEEREKFMVCLELMRAADEMEGEEAL